MRVIKSIEPSSLARVIGGILFGLTLLWLIPTEFFLLKEAVIGKISFFNAFFVWFFLLIFPGIGYLVGTITGYLYNIITKKFGGLEIDLE